MQKNHTGYIGTTLVFLASFGFLGSPDLVGAEESDPTKKVPAVERLGSDEALVVTGRPGTTRTGTAAGGQPGLDALLHLPSGYLGNGSPRPVAGASQAEWRRRFRNAEAELAKAERNLVSTRTELDGVAAEGGANQWAVAPPGQSSSGSASSPLSFKLRQALVRDRERVEGAEKALRELRIEADLAGVPEAWRIEASAAQ